MKPTATFKGFKAGQKVTIPIVVEYWAQFQTDFMPRYAHIPRR
jgi:hexosaminidase